MKQHLKCNFKQHIRYLGCITWMYSWFKVDLDCFIIRVIVDDRVSKLT